MTTREIPVARVEEFSEGSRRIVRLDGRDILVARLNGQWCAVAKHSEDVRNDLPPAARQIPSTMLPRYRVRDDGRRVYVLVD